MHFHPRNWQIALALLCIHCFASQPSPELVVTKDPTRSRSELHYSVEWRLMHAGNATLVSSPPESPAQPLWRTQLHLESVGFVSKLYKINNDYSVFFNADFCATNTLLEANEGKKHRETSVAFQKPPGKASSVERDLLKNEVVSTKEIDVPPCVHDVLSALARLRTMDVKLGQTIELPVSDGKKSISARIEVQKREDVKTPAGKFKTIRYEAYLFNNVLYRRSGRLYIWLTDDERRLPVQFRIRLHFFLGTITLQLEKEEKT